MLVLFDVEVSDWSEMKARLVACGEGGLFRRMRHYRPAKETRMKWPKLLYKKYFKAWN